MMMMKRRKQHSPAVKQSFPPPTGTSQRNRCAPVPLPLPPVAAVRDVAAARQSVFPATPANAVAECACFHRHRLSLCQSEGKEMHKLGAHPHFLLLWRGTVRISGGSREHVAVLPALLDNFETTLSAMRTATMMMTI